MRATGDILFVSRSEQRFFSDPVAIICANAVEEVIPCFQRVARGVAGGLYAAGYLAYEAAAAFDPALDTHPPGSMPLLWFGLYREMKERSAAGGCAGEFGVGPWSALVSREDYLADVRRIRGLIERGETYQVNYTFPMQADFRGDTSAWFTLLCAAQRADFCARIDLGRHHVLSASPELFFRLEGNRLEARPMKGTRPRGRWPGEDDRIAAALSASEKDRAENIMIVDLLRNDMGRVSESGSVRVKDLYKVERYPTVWQMTSTVESRTSASVPEIMAALFPSGSVTGAPKVRTMRIIRELERYPRGIYCGAIGWWAPGRRAEFSVAIRAATVDTAAGRACYHVGGGITSGSSPEGEYRECLTKAALLSRCEPEHELIESLLLEGDYFLLDEHMERLSESAAYFGFAMDRAAVVAGLAEKKDALCGSAEKPYKVRLLLAADGAFRIEAAPITPLAGVRLGFAAKPVDPDDIFLYHKTTRRRVYEDALASRPDCDDVLLWNPKAEITESVVANVVLELDGKFLTPPVSSGLLQGTFRRHLLQRGKIRERLLHRDDVGRASGIHMVNSVRKWIPVEWIDGP